MKRTAQPSYDVQELPSFSPDVQPVVLTSRVLKPFVEFLEPFQRPTILDLGHISSRNISFFGHLGWRVHAHDFLRDYQETLEKARKEWQERAGIEDIGTDPWKTTLAGLDFRRDSLNGVLLWEILDRLPHVLAQEVVDRLSGALAPGGVMISFFRGDHPREERTHGRFRIRDQNRIMYIPQAPSPLDQWFYQNSEIMELFSHLNVVHFYSMNSGYREVLIQKPEGVHALNALH